MNYKISYLLSNNFNRYVTLKEATQQTGLSAREIATQLAELNLTMESIVGTEEQQVFITPITTEQWTKKLVNATQEYFVYSEEQRQALIYLLSYSAFEELSLFHFQDFLEISKGTAIADVKKLRKHLITQKIELVYSRKEGFFLAGDELEIRRVAQNYVARLVQDTVGKFGLFYWLNQFDLTLYAKIRDVIQKQTSELGLTIVPSRIDEVSLLIGLSYKRIQQQYLIDLADLNLLQSLTVYQASKNFFQIFFMEEAQMK